mgnify:CR=1 FL=1
MNITEAMLSDLLALVGKANAAIMDIYTSNTTVVEYKADNSPLTQADKASHEIITKGLAALFPEIPVISEEGNLDENLALVKQSTYWIVDPIDGTQDFVNRTGDFCIALGLVDGDEPVFGLVSAPTFNAVYYGGPATGSFKKVGDAKAIQIRSAELTPHVVGVSRSHVTEATDTYIATNYAGATLRPLGSMLKQMAIAEGSADVYPCIGQPLNLWDVAAGQAIIEGAGGTVKRLDGSKLEWHGADTLKVGDFIAKSF